jgi:hypothetical protein
MGDSEPSFEIRIGLVINGAACSLICRRRVTRGGVVGH